MAKLSRRRAFNHRHCGFTLIEVLVALVVLAIALAAVMRVITQAIDTTAALRDRTVALGVAQDRLALHQLQDDWPALETFDGVREQGGRQWYWQEKVVSTDLAQFRRIEVEVRARPEGEALAHVVGFLRNTQNTRK
ncbi:MAG TPA: type II secretion system minor pseudopilin GspI [Acidiferrobacterales bacterium]|nr:type II secretion system minor pseudopilin GspI [Acidiferrobacterales bacterium]